MSHSSVSYFVYDKILNFCANFLSLFSGVEGWMYVFPRPFDYYANQLLWGKTEIIDHGGFCLYFF